MKNFYKIFAAVIIIIILFLIGTNLYLLSAFQPTNGRAYRVEINRISAEIEEHGLNHIDLSEYNYVTNVEQQTGHSSTFYESTDSDYSIREIGNILYRFDYTPLPDQGHGNILLTVNIILLLMACMVIGMMLFIYYEILRPFALLREVPYELSKGNLTIPMKENRNRFFGKFVWGLDMLRENIEQQKQRELSLQREKKTLLLSISHDIKTPLSAIKLYAQALSKGLYPDPQKQIETAENINEKANEIEGYISQIIKTSKEDFLNLEVRQSEFYLSELMEKISVYYKEKFSLIKTAFSVEHYSDCILKGDLNRSIEVLQNVLENAAKYGNGHCINVCFSQEEDCQLVTIINDGCTLPESELPHIFDSFWRGSNVGSNNGSGLGLYICRQLMHNMDGDIFAEIHESMMCITAVFRKAV